VVYDLNVKKLILINGFPGSGKTTISKCLLEQLENAALIDTDDLMHVRPWDPIEKLFRIALENALLNAQNFFKHGYDIVAIAGCVHSKELFDVVHNSVGGEYKILYVQLQIDEETRKQRAGDRYTPLPLLITADDLAQAEFIIINTANYSVEDAASEIRKYA
jgi:shikimate kinase